MPEDDIFETADGFSGPSTMYVAETDSILKENGGSAYSQGGSDSAAPLAEIDHRLSQLTFDELAELSSKAVAQLCIRRQQEDLQAFADAFPAAVDSKFQQRYKGLLQSFLDMVSGMRVQISEQALDSTSSSEGTITISLPGLPDGVNVTRSRDNFYVNDGRTLLERNEVRVKMGGLDVYSGYWLAVDAPASTIEDPLQEEGIDTLRRIMEAAGIDLSGDIYEDALEYPFLSAMLAPFGPDAVQPFEEHLRQLHREVKQKHGGCWFSMPRPGKSGSPNGDFLESGTSHSTADGDVDVRSVPRSQLTAAEEAELELSKLDL